MIPVRLFNPSRQFQRNEVWTPTFVAKAQADALPAVCRLEGRGSLAIKSVATGSTQAFNVITSMRPGERIDDALVPYAGDTGLRPVASPWVSDDVSALVPQPVVVLEDGSEDTIAHQSAPAVSHQDPSLQVWEIVYVTAKGFVFTLYAYVYTNQDVVPFELHCAWSDRRVTTRQIDVKGIYFRVGELPHIDYRRALGLPEPFRVGDGSWVQILSGERTFADGAGIEVTGELFCTPQKPGAIGPPELLGRRIQNMQASAEGRGPAWGIGRDWNDEEWFGAFLHMPHDQREADHWAMAMREHDRFIDAINTPGDMWDQRPNGLQRYTGATGDQDGFSWSHTRQLLAADPTFAWRMRFSCSEAFRPIHQKTETGGIIRWIEDTQREWLTWSQTTHFRALPASKRRGSVASLGKDYYEPATRHPWTGKDDQHQGSSPIIECYGLSGSFMLKRFIEHEQEADLAAIKGRVGNARAVGRSLHTRCHRHRAIPNDDLLREAIAEKVHAVVQGSVTRFAVQSGNTSIIAPLVLHGPDNRILGGAYGFWSPWMEALGAKGLLHSSRVLDGADAEFARDYALAVARNVCKHSIKFVNGVWRLCYAVGWTNDQSTLPQPPSFGSAVETAMASFFASGSAPEHPADAPEFDEFVEDVESPGGVVVAPMMAALAGLVETEQATDDKMKPLPDEHYYEGSPIVQLSAPILSTWGGWTGNAVLVFLTLAETNDPDWPLVAEQFRAMMPNAPAPANAYMAKHHSGYDLAEITRRVNGE